MGFKRAEWHSGLTYQQTCRECRTLVQYTDYLLDFRPWYADGFVYCPRCRTPLRHSEQYAIDGPMPSQVVVTPPPVSTQETAVAGGELPTFCTKCGKKFNDGDAFCGGCGAKRG